MASHPPSPHTLAQVAPPVPMPTGQAQGGAEGEEYGSPSSSAGAPANKVRRTRISRACENCRQRRIKCQPPYPCQGCRDAGLQDCLVREKARPMRRRRSQQAGTAAIEASSYPDRTRFLRSLDEQLEEIYTSRTGETISLALNEQPSHPQCELSTPLPDLPDPLPPSVVEAMSLFTEFMLPFCSHMTAPRVVALFERYLTAPASLLPDQQALVLMCLALGFVRLQGFEPSQPPSHNPSETPNAPGRAISVPDNERLDVPFFRQSVHILETWGGASFTSLHALCGLWYYSCLTCTPDMQRMIVSWMISQAKELGIHRESTAVQHSYSPADRADLMFVQILYAHYWSTSLGQHAPIIKPGEFESMDFRSRPVIDNESVVALVVRRSLTELLVINTQILINLHDPRSSTMPLDWMLRMEEKWDRWCSTWVMDGRTTGNGFTDPFLGVLWDWGRISLRLVTVRDRRVSMSSLSVLARSATQVLVRYNAIYRRLPYNLMYQHLRQVVTCAHIVLVCFWRYEITKPEAEITLSIAVWIIGLMEPRWREMASEARRKIVLVAGALNLDLTPEAVDARLSAGDLRGIGSVLGNVSPETFLDAHGALGSLYETFQNFNQDTSTLPAWTIDPLFLATDYPTPSLR